MMDWGKHRKADQSTKAGHHIVTERSLGPSLLIEGPPWAVVMEIREGLPSLPTSAYQYPFSEPSCFPFSVFLLMFANLLYQGN